MPFNVLRRRQVSSDVHSPLQVGFGSASSLAVGSDQSTSVDQGPLGRPQSAVSTRQTTGRPNPHTFLSDSAQCSRRFPVRSQHSLSRQYHASDSQLSSRYIDQNKSSAWTECDAAPGKSNGTNRVFNDSMLMLIMI